MLKMTQPRVASAPPIEAPIEEHDTLSQDTKPPPELPMLVQVMEKLVAIEQRRAATEELATERALEKERASKDKSVNAIPEVMLTSLLGFAGVSWDERDKLNPLFAKLRAASARPERHAILRAFFNDLAEKDHSFTGSFACLTISSIISLHLDSPQPPRAKE